MSLSIYRKLGLKNPQKTLILQLSNKILEHPFGLEGDMLIKVDDHFFLIDFIVLDIDAQLMSLILR